MISSISSSSSSYLTDMLTQAMQKQTDVLFNKADGNGDGSIDKTEFSAFAKKLSEASGSSWNIDDIYSAYDANTDGLLSKDELTKFMTDNAPPPPADMNGVIGRMGAHRGRHRLDHLFGKLDSDNSGGISKTEFAPFADKMAQCTGNSINVDTVFTSYDSNNDGTLSKDELAAFMKDTAPAAHAQTFTAAADAASNDPTSLLELMKNPEFSDTLSKLLTIMKQYANTEHAASAINIAV